MWPGSVYLFTCLQAQQQDGGGQGWDVGTPSEPSASGLLPPGTVSDGFPSRPPSSARPRGAFPIRPGSLMCNLLAL